MLKILPDCVDDTDICLMKQIMIDFRRGKSRFIQSSSYILRSSCDGKLKHILSLHLQRNIGFLLCYVRRWLQFPVLPKLFCRTGCRELYAFDIASGRKNSCSGTISEEDTCPSVIPICHLISRSGLIHMFWSLSIRRLCPEIATTYHLSQSF